LLSQDAAVSVKLLRAANAAQYGNLRKLDTVESAVSRLGLNGACNIAEIVTNRSLYTTRNSAYRILLEELWLHSVACAHASEAIGRHLGKSSWQKLFSLGLLHDVGKLALLQAVAQSDPEGRRIDGEENRKTFRQFLEAQHVACGVSLMQQWNFHQDFHLIARYHEDIRGADKNFRTLLIVHMANQFVRTLGYGDPLDSPQTFETSPAKMALFPGEVDLSFVAEAVQHAVEETRSLVG
jgi:HD-like signal output (HDOD) protein